MVMIKHATEDLLSNTGAEKDVSEVKSGENDPGKTPHRAGKKVDVEKRHEKGMAEYMATKHMRESHPHMGGLGMSL